ncbi:MAG: DNA-binding protein [Chloroflexota bacterium]
MTKDSQSNNNLPRTSASAQRALESVGITTLKQLTDVTEAELLMLHGMGPKVIRILREALKAKGLSFCETTKRGAMRKKKHAGA